MRRKVRWSRVCILIVILMVFFAVAAGAATYAYNHFIHPSVVAFANKPAAEKSAAKLSNNINILLLGVDDGDNEHPSGAKRSDTMMVASINPDNGTINLLSIPRDTRVTIPGHSGLDKITHAHFYGGPQLAMRTVEGFLEMPMNYYVAIDWQAFIKIIDILGGVDLYVENNMKYEDPYANLKINLEKGYQHLNGEKSGQYVRFRSDELGDIGRVQRQQRFMKAVSGEVFQISTLTKIPALISTVNQYVTTNMTAVDMLKVANSIKTFKSGSLHTEMLPGNFATIGGLSYWVPNREQTKQVVERLLYPNSAKMSGIYGAPGARNN